MRFEDLLDAFLRHSNVQYLFEDGMIVHVVWLIDKTVSTAPVTLIKSAFTG